MCARACGCATLQLSVTLSVSLSLSLALALSLPLCVCVCSCNHTGSRRPTYSRHWSTSRSSSPSSVRSFSESSLRPQRSSHSARASTATCLLRRECLLFVLKRFIHRSLPTASVSVPTMNLQPKETDHHVGAGTSDLLCGGRSRRCVFVCTPSAAQAPPPAALLASLAFRCGLPARAGAVKLTGRHEQRCRSVCTAGRQ